MADDRLLAPLRRFWNEEQVTTAYEAIFTAFHSRLEQVTVIVSKGTEGDSAAAQVVVQADDYLAWMDACEIRLNEFDNEAAGVTGELEMTTHANFGATYGPT